MKKSTSKIALLVGCALISIGALVGSAFAYFNFSSDSFTKQDSTANKDYVNNIKFDQETKVDTNREYTLYFFASPYYATGTSSDDISSGYSTNLTDPLTIANDTNNNYYNDTTKYCLGGTNLGYNYAFANLRWDDSTCYHLCLPDDAIDTTKVKDDPTYNKDDPGLIKYFYEKRDFSGYINLLNEETIKNNVSDIQIGRLNADGIQEENDIRKVNGSVSPNNSYNGITTNTYNNAYANIYSYVKITVKGGIKTEVLSKIIAQSVFKDKYGFGPEFMGWSYNKEEVFNRTVYQDSSNTTLRYITNCSNTSDVMTDICKSGEPYRAWGCAGNDGSSGIISEQIGNYGDYGAIDLFSSEDSLYEIDSKGLDGSNKNDHIIYLYPVFGSKNNIKRSSSDSQVAILKMRTNPGSDYTHKQSDEIDYSNNRFTNMYNYISSADITKGEANYSVKGFYVDMSDSNTNKEYRLDINILNSYGGWAEKWYTLLQTSTLNTLGFYEDFYKTYVGYFDIDIVYKATTESLDISSCGIKTLEKPEQYINSVEIRRASTLDDHNNTIYIYYSIGLKRNNSLAVSGINGNSITTYNSDEDSALYQSEYEYEDSASTTWKFYFTNPIKFSVNQNVSIFYKEYMLVRKLYPFNFTTLNSDALSNYNQLIEDSNMENKEKFLSCYEESSTDVGISYFNNEVNGYSDFPNLIINREGTYELLVAVKYHKGFPQEMQVGFRDLTFFNLMILNSKPSDSLLDAQGHSYTYSNIFKEYNSNNGILAAGIFQRDTIINTTSSFTEGTNIESILSSETYKDYKIYDLATNQDVTNLIKDSKFVLSRNMILYLSK